MPKNGKVVILQLDGDFHTQGFKVILEIGLEGERPYISTSGSLPPSSQLLSYLEKWQRQYRKLGSHLRIKPQEIIYGGTVNELEKLLQLNYQLSYELKIWLESRSFLKVDQLLREELSRHEPIRILIRTDNYQIHKLPWYQWDFLERYPQAELALSASKFERVTTNPSNIESDRVRILAVFGNSEGIDTSTDRELLTALPNVDPVCLIEPKRSELTFYLWEEAWDILFFAGHSKTESDRGLIYLNAQDCLTIQELKFGIRKAIASGLQLAIFNSCEGLGLAYELEQLSLGQIIVMREPVPDTIAQEFLKNFLKTYARGDSLYSAARQARERLQGLEHQFPCASWLPIIYQNPAVSPPSWQDLWQHHGDRSFDRELAGVVIENSTQTNLISENPVSTSLERREDFDCNPPSRLQNFYLSLKKYWLRINWRTIQIILVVSLIVTNLVMGIRSQGVLQGYELKAFDLLIRWRSIEVVDNRILVVTIDEPDIQYQQSMNMPSQGSLSDLALDQFLQKITPYQPQAIGLDIIHDFPFEANLAKNLQNTQPFVAICRIESPESNLVSISPPPQFPLENLGFSNFTFDPDSVIRRQILGMSADNICQSDRSLSFSLASLYLHDRPIKMTPFGLKIGDLSIQKLENNAGGYQLPPQEVQGYQILLNYRSSLPQSVSLQSILNGTVDDRLEQLIKNRIILIGSIRRTQDLHDTPYSMGDMSLRISGVFVHAQMISQIISAVLDGRSLLWWYPEWLEGFWVQIWSAVGGILVWQLDIFKSALKLGLALLFLFVGCYLALDRGAWIPLIPPILTMLITAITILIYRSRLKN